METIIQDFDLFKETGTIENDIDGYNAFEQLVQNKLGVSYKNIIRPNMVLERDLGDTFIYYWQDYMIQNECGNYLSIYKFSSECEDCGTLKDNCIC